MPSPESSMLAEIAASYDEVTYGSLAHKHTHPIRIATCGALRGLPWAPIEQCRVLELGCAEGGNLLPVAEAYPGSTFVGVDLSRRQVELANERIAALGLDNVSVHQLDLQEIDDRFGDFDYVIAHGVYSWVPPQVQDRLLRVCRERLTDRGLAYVSYNTYPGWQVPGVLRTMVLAQLDPADPLPMRIAQARKIAEALATHVDASSPYGALLLKAAAQLATADDGYVAHEFLEVVNVAVPFTQFLGHAAHHGLDFVDDLVVRTTIAPSDIASQQYHDLVTGCPFRASVLSGRPAPADEPPRDVLVDMFIAADLSPQREVEFDDESPADFETVGGRTVSTTSAVLKRLLVELSSHWPASVRIGDLVGPTDDVIPGLLSLHRTGTVEITTQPFAVDTAVSARPVVSASTRLEATLGTVVANGRYDRHELGDFDRFLVELLDGTRTEDELVALVLERAVDGELEFSADDEAPLTGDALEAVVTESVRAGLEHLASIGLLIA